MYEAVHVSVDSVICCLLLTSNLWQHSTAQHITAQQVTAWSREARLGMNEPQLNDKA
jgi:hypothetical protein